MLLFSLDGIAVVEFLLSPMSQMLI
uniref:Uncharacterized protein n=1 Tax=Lepeophtheirus salmonis TaxID=72036 RepID=A0A0K2U489_LEPSM